MEKGECRPGRPGRKNPLARMAGRGYNASMKTLVNILIAAAGVVVVIALARLAWGIAGFLLKLLLGALIFVILVGLCVYLYRQFKSGRT